MRTYRLPRSHSLRLRVEDPTPLLLSLSILPFSFLLLLSLLYKTRGDPLFSSNLMQSFLANRILDEAVVVKAVEGCPLLLHLREYLFLLSLVLEMNTTHC
jgi:hypothetical protein